MACLFTAVSVNTALFSSNQEKKRDELTLTNVNHSMFAGRIRFTSVNNNSARTAKHLLGAHTLTGSEYSKENH